MKKQLSTDGIMHELAQSVFFSKRESEQPNKGTSALSNNRTDERVIAPPPESMNVHTPERTHERTPERTTPPSPVKLSTRSLEQSNERTVKPELAEKTERYSFEIYPSQKEHMEEYLYQHKRKTKEKISASRFIRTAIDYYFKTLK